MAKRTTKTQFTPEEVSAATRLMADIPLFCEQILKINTKAGGLVPFKLNKGQLFLHKAIEKQKRETGKVRVVLLKGRQMGFSTYVAARFYHKTIWNQHLNTLIVANKLDATGNLFNMVKTYYDNSHPKIRPPLKTSSEKRMEFKDTGGSYKVGSAGNKDVGRSGTTHNLHGSEVAFWENASEVASALFNTIGDSIGTEIILESTANGMGNYYHQQWQLAERGESEFIAVFIPWYWEPEYKRTCPPNFVLDDEEKEYQLLYELSDEQMCWKRNKESIQGQTLEEGKSKFKQEYPANPTEAFQFSAVESFIKPELVVKARKQKPHRSVGAITAGYDPSQGGGDSDAFIIRQGMNAFDLDYPKFNTTAQRVQYLADKLSTKIPYIDKLFIDAGGGGYEIASLLKDNPFFSDRVMVISFGGKADEERKYVNKKAEMHGRAKEWIMDEHVPPSLPDNDRFQAEITTAGYDVDLSGRLKIEEKKSIRSRGMKSPDGNDAWILTFAKKVVRNHTQVAIQDQPGHYQDNVGGTVDECIPWFDQATG